MALLHLGFPCIREVGQLQELRQPGSCTYLEAGGVPGVPGVLVPWSDGSTEVCVVLSKSMLSDQTSLAPDNKNKTVSLIMMILTFVRS